MTDHISSYQYFPPNQRDLPLFKFVEAMLDHGIENYFYTNSDTVSGIYDPFSSSYDPSYILELTGSTTLASLLSSDVDQVSAAALVPMLTDLKGTAKGIDTILRFIKLQYQNLIKLKQRGGCNEGTILLKSGVSVSAEEIVLLKNLAREIFPVCLSLSGVTNCSSKYLMRDGYATDEWSYDVGQHKLSQGFVLGTSNLSRAQGTIVPGTSIASLFCNPDQEDIDIQELSGDQYLSLTASRSVAIAYDIIGLASAQYLDQNLVLSRGTSIDRLSISMIGSKSNSYDIPLDITADVSMNSYSYCYGVMVPGYNTLSRSDNRLSHNYTYSTGYGTVDFGKLDDSVVLSRGISNVVKVLSISRNYANDDCPTSVSDGISQITESFINTRDIVNDIHMEEQYDADIYDAGYQNDGLKLALSEVNTRDLVTEYTADITSSISTGTLKTSTVTSDQAYAISNSGTGHTENDYIRGLYSQFYYDELIYGA